MLVKKPDLTLFKTFREAEKLSPPGITGGGSLQRMHFHVEHGNEIIKGI
jgi:hypothetical protein